jgi:hypothetical protein
MRRLTYEEVKHFVEVKSGSGCKLLSEEYFNSDSKMIFRCRCNNIFETTFDKFKSRNKRQCNKCARKKISKSQKLKYEEVKNFIEVESESGCKLISKTYSNANEKLLIQCACGNLFKTKFNHFKSSNQRQCNNCGKEKVAQSKRLDIFYIKKFIEEESNSGCKLITKEYKNSSTKLKIECACGNTFTTLFSVFRDYNRRCCDICAKKNKKSQGEFKIENYLIKKDVSYESEYRFDDCRNKRPLPFDFAIFNKKDEIICLVEFDGKQHSHITWNFAKTLEDAQINLYRTKYNDKIKNNYCKKNNIPLIRIPFNYYTKLEYILEHVLGYFKLIDKQDIDEQLVHKFLVNHPDWSHEKYINSAL